MTTLPKIQEYYRRRPDSLQVGHQRRLSRASVSAAAGHLCSPATRTPCASHSTMHPPPSTLITVVTKPVAARRLCETTSPCCRCGWLKARVAHSSASCLEVRFAPLV